MGPHRKFDAFSRTFLSLTPGQGHFVRRRPHATRLGPFGLTPSHVACAGSRRDPRRCEVASGRIGLAPLGARLHGVARQTPLDSNPCLIDCLELLLTVCLPACLCFCRGGGARPVRLPASQLEGLGCIVGACVLCVIIFQTLSQNQMRPNRHTHGRQRTHTWSLSCWEWVVHAVGSQGQVTG